MKNTIVAVVGLLAALILSGLSAQGQGFFIYDQQSSTNQAYLLSGAVIQNYNSFGQSFTPTSSTMNFIRLGVHDGRPGDGLGASLHLNMHSGTIDGPLLATSPSMAFPSGYRSYTDFIFDNDIPLTPGSLYVFEIIAEPGSGEWGISLLVDMSYPGGAAIFNGLSGSGLDLWFREGTYMIPEPSAFAIVLLGAGVFAWRSRSRTCSSKGMNR